VSTYIKLFFPSAASITGTPTFSKLTCRFAGSHPGACAERSKVHGKVVDVLKKTAPRIFAELWMLDRLKTVSALLLGKAIICLHGEHRALIEVHDVLKSAHAHVFP